MPLDADAGADDGELGAAVDEPKGDEDEAVLLGGVLVEAAEEPDAGADDEELEVGDALESLFDGAEPEDVLCVEPLCEGDPALGVGVEDDELAAGVDEADEPLCDPLVVVPLEEVEDDGE